MRTDGDVGKAANLQGLTETDKDRLRRATAAARERLGLPAADEIEQLGNLVAAIVQPEPPTLLATIIGPSGWWDSRENPTEQHMGAVVVVKCPCGRKHTHGWDLRDGLGVRTHR